MRRIAQERIDKAVRALERAGGSSPEAIHDARKRFKELRAVLRLARVPLGDRYRSENLWYRDAGRALSAAREAQATLATWDALLERFPDLHAEPEAAAVAGRLAERLGSLSDGAAPATEAARGRLLEALPEARARVASWPLEGAGFDDLAPGLRRTYRQGRRGLQQAHGTGDDASFHEWRKRAKDLWYHTKMLSPVWPQVMRARRKQLAVLAERLGDDHDLVILRQVVGEEPTLFGREAFRAELAGRIAMRQQRLRLQAYRLGRQLYAERPKAYARRLGAHWESWRGP